MNTTGTLLRKHRHGGREGCRAWRIEQFQTFSSADSPASRCSHAPPAAAAERSATGRRFPPGWPGAVGQHPSTLAFPPFRPRLAGRGRLMPDIDSPGSIGQDDPGAEKRRGGTPGAAPEAARTRRPARDQPALFRSATASPTTSTSVQLPRRRVPQQQAEAPDQQQRPATDAAKAAAAGSGPRFSPMALPSPQVVPWQAAQPISSYFRVRRLRELSRFEWI